MSSPPSTAGGADTGSRVSFSRADVTDWKSLSSFFAGVKAKAGSVNMVFANAGAIQDSVIWEDEMDVDGNLAEPQLLTLDVTLKGVVLSRLLGHTGGCQLKMCSCKIGHVVLQEK